MVALIIGIYMENAFGSLPQEVNSLSKDRVEIREISQAMYEIHKCNVTTTYKNRE